MVNNINAAETLCCYDKIIDHEKVFCISSLLDHCYQQCKRTRSKLRTVFFFTAKYQPGVDRKYQWRLAGDLKLQGPMDRAGEPVCNGNHFVRSKNYAGEV